jgi:hypothetical protein
LPRAAAATDRRFCFRPFPLARAARSYLIGSNLKGTISPLIGAFVKIKVFDVTYNSLSGTVPADLSQWTVIERFGVSLNNFSGAQLPSMSFTTIFAAGGEGYCRLMATNGNNTFNCPWPSEAENVCTISNMQLDVLLQALAAGC